MAILTKLLYLNLGCLLLASHPAAASFGNACLLARANKKTVRNDLKTCFEDMRGDDTWNYKVDTPTSCAPCPSNENADASFEVVRQQHLLP